MTSETLVTVTPKAAEHLLEVIKNDNKDPRTAALRVFVQGGGCSGFQYGLKLHEEGEDSPSDIHFESNGIKVIIDPISITYLKNAEVDFVDNESGGGFQIKNPQAKSTCGCGSSFSTDEQNGEGNDHHH
ncbi:MAG: iron-sulfur cluster insertion protein ErpA [Candidatus Taylorbacteria bacterium]|nr:iron-sulfur cluster insertion protein ErpA [Candidatus Taylorbacteria bacterium]